MSAILNKRNCECGIPASSLRVIFGKGETDFRRCPECGLVFRAVFPSESELVEIYCRAYEAEKISGGGTNQESGLHAANSYALFIRHLVKNSAMRVLDYGAGSGQLVSQLRAKGIHADGLEFSAEARKYCEKVRGFSLLNDLSEVKAGQYDLVSMIEVIEHLTELQTTLAELRRVLTPGGTLLITTPNLEGYRARKEKGYWHEACKKFHLFLFTEDSLRFHLDRAGFSYFDHRRFNPLQRPGLKFWLSARLSQLAGLGGTLCLIARRGAS
jgi:SAM-dependent methyltransferase